MTYFDETIVEENISSTKRGNKKLKFTPMQHSYWKKNSVIFLPRLKLN